MKIFILIIILAMYGAVRLVIDLIRVFRYLIKEEIKAWEKHGGDRLNANTVNCSIDALIYSNIDLKFVDPCEGCKVGTEKQRCKVCEVPQSALDEEARLRMESERA